MALSPEKNEEESIKNRMSRYWRVKKERFAERMKDRSLRKPLESSLCHEVRLLISQFGPETSAAAFALRLPLAGERSAAALRHARLELRRSFLAGLVARTGLKGQRSETDRI